MPLLHELGEVGQCAGWVAARQLDPCGRERRSGGESVASRR